MCKGRCRASARRRDCKKAKIQRNTIPQSASLTAPFAQESLSINQAFTYKIIQNLLSEARLRLPSPVGEGAELAEADEVSATVGSAEQKNSFRQPHREPFARSGCHLPREGGLGDFTHKMTYYAVGVCGLKFNITNIELGCRHCRPFFKKRMGFGATPHKNGVFFLQSFFFCAFCAKRKSDVGVVVSLCRGFMSLF